MSKSTQQSSVGEPMYIESLLTDDEYKECASMYISTYSNGRKKPDFFNSPMKWRFGMGKSLTSFEITLINTRLEAVLIKAGIKV